MLTSLKSLRIKYQGYRHNIYVLRNRFNQDNAENDFQPSVSGIYGCWFYILIEEVLTIIIEVIRTLETFLHKK